MTKSRYASVVVVMAGVVLSAVGTAHADDLTMSRSDDGNTVSWQSDQGNGTVTFYDDEGRFQGGTQFPGEGPIG
ncbi:hypothetical protein [Streptomyces sp. NPDC090132]